MKFVDAGINETSIHYFVHPTPFALEHLYYIQSLGKYDVDSSYKVNRLNYNSFLIIVVVAGNIRCHQGDEAATASAGEILLLDCHKPHTYYALNNATFYFLHFGGGTTESLHQYVHEQCGLMISCRNIEAFTQTIKQFMAVAQSRGSWSETNVSAEIYRLLMSLLASTSTHRFSQDDQQTVRNAAEYISKHLSEKLNVDDLAHQYGYSAGYFSKVFKSSTGFAPYQYIQNARLDYSRHLLSNTTLSIQEIADRSGFTSLANFSFAFRKSSGKTPSDYRRHPV